MRFLMMALIAYLSFSSNVLLAATSIDVGYGYTEKISLTEPRYNVKFVMSNNKIVEMATFSGFLVVDSIHIRGDSCAVSVRYQKAGQKYMISNKGNAFTATDFHNETCVIRKSNWQPPQ